MRIFSKKILERIFSYFLLAAALFGLIKLLIWAGNILNKLDQTIAVAIIAGAFTIIASTATIVVGKYTESSNARKAAHREKKIIFYEEYINKLVDQFSGGNSQPNISSEYLNKIHKKIILWSGPKVIIKYSNWMDTLKRSGPNPSAKTMIDMISFFLAVRQDLGLSNAGIKADHLVNFLLKEPRLFMKMFKENPGVKMSEIAEAEKDLNEKKLALQQKEKMDL